VEGAADRLWRPLVNGRRQPQISAFAVAPLRGFGLLQRERRFSAYLDVQARHEARPGLWVAPAAGAGVPEGGGFGAGAVQLFEIPSREEYMDNVVAAFVPSGPVLPGAALRLGYELTTVGAEPAPVLPLWQQLVFSVFDLDQDTRATVDAVAVGRRVGVDAVRADDVLGRE